MMDAKIQDVRVVNEKCAAYLGVSKATRNRNDETTPGQKEKFERI